MVLITIVTGDYKPTNITGGGPHCRCKCISAQYPQVISLPRVAKKWSFVISVRVHLLEPEGVTGYGDKPNAIHLPFVDGLYNPFMVIYYGWFLWMCYYWVDHIGYFSKKFLQAGYTNIYKPYIGICHHAACDPLRLYRPTGLTRWVMATVNGFSGASGPRYKRAICGDFSGICVERRGCTKGGLLQGIWVWVNTYRYIFSGMNIHLPAILGFTRGTRFWPIAIWEGTLQLNNI